MEHSSSTPTHSTMTNTDSNKIARTDEPNERINEEQNERIHEYGNLNISDQTWTSWEIAFQTFQQQLMAGHVTFTW